MAAAAGMPSWRSGHLDHVKALALLCAVTELGWGMSLVNIRPLPARA